MNKNFKLFALLMLFFHTGIANVNAQPLLKFDVDTAQFGKVYAGDTVLYDFGFTNVGNEDLIIKQAWPACGCTTPTFTEGAIKPGERGVIKVQFRSAGFAGQTMVKQIIVINNGAEKYAVFKVKVVDKAIEEDILKHQSQTKSAEPKKKKKKTKSVKFKPSRNPEF